MLTILATCKSYGKRTRKNALSIPALLSKPSLRIHKSHAIHRSAVIQTQESNAVSNLHLVITSRYALNGVSQLVDLTSRRALAGCIHIDEAEEDKVDLS